MWGGRHEGMPYMRVFHTRISRLSLSLSLSPFCVVFLNWLCEIVRPLGVVSTLFCCLCDLLLPADRRTSRAETPTTLLFISSPSLSVETLSPADGSATCPPPFQTCWNRSSTNLPTAAHLTPPPPPPPRAYIFSSTSPPPFFFCRRTTTTARRPSRTPPRALPPPPGRATRKYWWPRWTSPVPPSLWFSVSPLPLMSLAPLNWWVGALLLLLVFSRLLFRCAHDKNIFLGVVFQELRRDFSPPPTIFFFLLKCIYRETLVVFPCVLCVFFGRRTLTTQPLH